MDVGIYKAAGITTELGCVSVAVGTTKASGLRLLRITSKMELLIISGSFGHRSGFRLISQHRAWLSIVLRADVRLRIDSPASSTLPYFLPGGLTWLDCADHLPCRLLKAMANWHDPAREYAENTAHIKLVHVIGGLYIWEVLLNIDYEYSIIMGKRKFTHASSLYITCRWCTLLAVILEFLGFDAPQRIGCQALITTLFTFSTLAYSSASALIILRIFALWERKRVVVTIASTVWLANTASYVRSIATSRGHVVGGYCVLDDAVQARTFIFSTFATDLVLLAFMLRGVLRWKIDGEMGGIWWVLFTQGLAWVVIFTVAEVPPVVFISLNLNDAMDRMFTFPVMVVMTVAASRMYLGLVNSSAFHSPPVTASINGRSTVMEIKRAGTPDCSHLPESSFGMGGARPKSYDLTDDAHDVLGVHEGDKWFGGNAV